jgi:hypothetical protein
MSTRAEYHHIKRQLQSEYFPPEKVAPGAAGAADDGAGE